MKGIIIYGNPLWGDNAGATYCDFINEASLDLKYINVGEIEDCLKGKAGKSSKAVCSPDDSYDFEIGALISLMKMCGLEKSAKAYAEIFDDTAYGDALIERDRLKKDYEDLKDLYGKLGERDKYLMEDINKKLGYIKEKDEEIKKLKKDDAIKIKNLKEKVDDLWDYNKGLIDEIDQKNHEIISLKALKLTNESLKKDNESFRKTCEKLKEENQRLKNENSLLRNKNNELTEKKKDLKKRLGAMYGYIDTDNVKPELPRTLDINGVTYRKGVSLKDLSKTFDINRGFMITGWDPEKDFVEQLHKWGGITEFTFDAKPLTKREKMWGKILGDCKYGDCLSIKVEKAFINDFLSEAKENGLVWANGEKPTEWDKWEVWRTYDYIVFRVLTWGKLKELTWGRPSDEKTIDYLPPMRWDLFKKGRIIVGVRRDQYNDFRDEITRQLGLTNQHKHYEDYNYTFYRYDKKSNFIEALGRSQFREIKAINGHKVVYWEDVR